MNEEISLKTKKILFVSHDGNRAGAQLFLLQVVRYFHDKNQPKTKFITAIKNGF